MNRSLRGGPAVPEVSFSVVILISPRRRRRGGNLEWLYGFQRTLNEARGNPFDGCLSDFACGPGDRVGRLLDVGLPPDH